MKILHLCLGCFYIDNYSYQENMLPKYHKKMGYDVTVIASLVSFDKNGQQCLLATESEYVCADHYKVIRIDFKPFMRPLNRILKRYNNTYSLINDEHPDIIFVHGCQFLDIRYVVKYVRKHRGVRLFVDNHSDVANSARNIVSKYILHRILWRYWAKQIEPYTAKFYGVLPARVEFLKNVYKLPELKCDLLVIGADDERVILAKEEITKRKVRERHNIAMDEFVIITGGKIDSGKKQILLLIRAISALRLANVKLLVFGSVINHLRDELFALVDNDRIQYIGWLESDEVYDYFGASDLAVFPGGHSVLWEQAVAVGIPCVFKYWNGMTHVDVGGNCKFIYNDTVEEISNILIGIINDRDVHSKMKKVAEEKGLKTFSYKEIARRAIQLD